MAVTVKMLVKKTETDGAALRLGCKGQIPLLQSRLTNTASLSPWKTSCGDVGFITAQPWVSLWFCLTEIIVKRLIHA